MSFFNQAGCEPDHLIAEERRLVVFDAIVLESHSTIVPSAGPVSADVALLSPKLAPLDLDNDSPGRLPHEIEPKFPTGDQSDFPGWEREFILMDLAHELFFEMRFFLLFPILILESAINGGLKVSHQLEPSEIKLNLQPVLENGQTAC